MLNITLIIPPSPFLLDERVFPSLGVLKVAAVLEQAGLSVAVLDLSGEPDYLAKALAHAAQHPADRYGFTLTTAQLPSAITIARALAQAVPRSLLIAGGPHVTLTQAAARRGVPRAAAAMAQLARDFHILVAGDGEKAIFEALRAEAPALIDADDPTSPLFLTDQDLDRLPLPARHLIDLDRYHYTLNGLPATNIVAQLGCPFSCGFCGGRSSPSFRRVRSRSIPRIIEEIHALRLNYGYRGFMFQDDELNLSASVLSLMEALWREGRLTLRGFVKAQLLTDAQAEAMAKAGMHTLLIGFESGSPRILQNMRKQSTREENTRALMIARRHGIKVKALMSLGHPGETEETVQETRDWLLDVAPDDLDVTVLTVYPGTPYYDQAEEVKSGVWAYRAPKTGDVLYSQAIDWTQDAAYYKGVPGHYRSFVWTDHLSPERLTALRDELERELRLRLDIPWLTIMHEHSMGQA